MIKCDVIFEWALNRDIALTEIDIENPIRVKGAIFSGCQTLLEEAGLDSSGVELVVPAGWFGSFVPRYLKR